MHAHVGMTKAPFKNALFWAQKELNIQRAKKQQRNLDEYLSKLPGVKELKDEIYTETRYQKLEAMADLQVR